MISFLLKVWNTFLDILFPKICLSCQKFIKENSLLCANCLKSISINNALACPTCFARLPDNKKICHFENNFLFGAASSYENSAIRELIHALKFKRIEKASVILSSFLIKYARLANLNLENFFVVPMPISKQRFRERGFNQSELIAKKFAAAFSLPLKNCLFRIKNSQPQSEIKSKELRMKNVSGCFQAENSVYNKNIILIDDVFTTGVTAREAVKTLRAAGASKIIVLVTAKA